MDWYNLTRALHIIAVIAWMAGMMYLPRLYAYHTETAPPGSEFDAHFLIWERKLLKIIINPSMILAFVFGLALIWIDATQVRGGWDFLLQPWMIVKLAGVVFLGAWHGMLSRAFRQFEQGERPRPAKFWRATNEIPFLVAAVMVLAVTLEFFSR